MLFLRFEGRCRGRAEILLQPRANLKVGQVFDLRRSVTLIYQDIGNTFGGFLFRATTVVVQVSVLISLTMKSR